MASELALDARDDSLRFAMGLALVTSFDGDAFAAAGAFFNVDFGDGVGFVTTTDFGFDVGFFSLFLLIAAFAFSIATCCDDTKPRRKIPDSEFTGTPDRSDASLIDNPSALIARKPSRSC